MRFAVSLLMFICVASVVGTVLQQNRSSSNYIDQFGPFWYEVFDKFSIWHVYNSWWFLLIMAFLVVSTTVCLIRNAPKMLRDARSFREHVRASSLRAFPHRVESQEPTDVPSTVTGLKTLLGRFGYAVRERQDGDGVLLAAKKGSANRLGYVFAHAAMVIICIGGLLDSELPVRLQVMFGGKAHRREHADLRGARAAGCRSTTRASAPACWCRGRPGLHRRGHGGRRRAGAAHALHAQAQEIRRRLLLHRHAQPLRQRSGGHRSRHRQELRVHHRGQ